MSTIISIVTMIFLISILILVHEAGHFFAAKMFKMKVAKFGFGLPIGPTIYEKQIGDLKILVHAFLLGGYVAFPDDEKDINLPKNSPDRFLNRPIYQRLVVVSAGVAANVVIALIFVLLTAVLWGHMPSGKYEVYVRQIFPEKNEFIKESGILENDKILEINGSEINSSYALHTFAQLSKKFDGKVDENLVRENYEKLKKLNIAYKQDEIIPEEIIIQLPEQVDEKTIKLTKNQLRGVEKYKDKQLELNDLQKSLREKVIGKNYIISDGKISLNDVAMALSDNMHPLYITVLRNNRKIKLNPIYSTQDGIIGIQPEIHEIVVPTKGVKSIISVSYNYLYDQTYILLYGLGQIVIGKIPLKDLHGIVAIVKVGGDVIQYKGFFSGLLLTAIISLDLAIVNFLPIPALDGGHVLFLLLEKINGKPLDEKAIDKIGTFCFILLVLLMIFVIFNDIFALITKQI